MRQHVNSLCRNLLATSGKLAPLLLTPIPRVQAQPFREMSTRDAISAHRGSPREPQVARAIRDEREAIGIIISRGTREEPIPRFSLYVWGPAPKQTAQPATKAA
jgi:hypothetical protein